MPSHYHSAPRTDYALLTQITKIARDDVYMYVHSARTASTHRTKQTCAALAINSPLRRDVRTYVCPRHCTSLACMYVPPGLSAHGTYPPTLLLTQVTGIPPCCARALAVRSHAVAAPATALRPLGRTLFRHRGLHSTLPGKGSSQGVSGPVGQSVAFRDT